LRQFIWQVGHKPYKLDHAHNNYPLKHYRPPPEDKEMKSLASFHSFIPKFVQAQLQETLRWSNFEKYNCSSGSHMSRLTSPRPIYFQEIFGYIFNCSNHLERTNSWLVLFVTSTLNWFLWNLMGQVNCSVCRLHTHCHRLNFS